MSERSLVLLSRSVFTGLSDEPMDGFVAIRGNRIEAVGPASQAAPYAESAEEVRDMGPRTIMAGLVDVHTFFTGWVLRRAGADLSGAATPAGVVEALLAWGLEHEGAPRRPRSRPARGASGHRSGPRAGPGLRGAASRRLHRGRWDLRPQRGGPRALRLHPRCLLCGEDLAAHGRLSSPG